MFVILFRLNLILPNLLGRLENDGPGVNVYMVGNLRSVWFNEMNAKYIVILSIALDLSTLQ